MSKEYFAKGQENIDQSNDQQKKSKKHWAEGIDMDQFVKDIYDNIRRKSSHDNEVDDCAYCEALGEALGEVLD